MKKRFLENYNFLLFVFILGSFIGFVWENIWTIIKGHYALRQGLIYEPLIPIYGVGALVFFFIYKNIEIKTNNKIVKLFLIFVLAFSLGGAIEYIASLLQEKILGTISWNYSHLKFNLNGRISFKHSSFWGFLGVIFYYWLLPQLIKIKNWLSNKKISIVTIILTIILFLDCSISFMACLRQRERRKEIEPSNKIEEFLDKHYDDEYLNRIFNNAREVKKD